MSSTEENAYKMLYNWTMEELLKLTKTNNKVYKEDSIYLGGSRRYIPPQDWYTVIEDLVNPDRRWRAKFLYNMSKLGDKSKCEEDEEHDTICVECQQPTVDEEDRLCHKCYHKTCAEGDCWCNCYCDD